MRDWDWLRPNTINLYQYCGNDPINVWDPDGRSPVSVFAKWAAKKGAVKAAKHAAKKAIKGRLKAYASKKWAKTFVDDALTAIDLATTQSWWEYGLELVPVAGDAYGGAKLTKQGYKLWKIAEKFESMAGSAAKVAQKAWKKMELTSNLSGKGADIVGSVVKKMNNIGLDHLKADDLAGAVRDMYGEAVQIGGRTFDHLDEVTNNITAMGNQLAKLRKAIDNGQLDGDALKAAESIYQNVSKRLDSVKNTMRQAKKAAEEYVD